MSTEILDVVNEQDIVTDQQPRSAVHQRGLWHRGVHVFLFTEDGKLLVQQRSADRKQYASLWDGSVSEHVQAGEDYLAAAQRGLWEELGLRGVTLTPRLRFRLNYGPGDNEISRLYEGIVNPDEVRFDPVEIEQVSYFSMDEIKKIMAVDKARLCGWFIEILNWRFGNPSKLQVLK